ncbi:hypothetical protein QWY85_17895 [Neolewinella lacunae]|uniref:Lipoprotein n=1 Tax=Neolewinella lacunae TaxID=1517758 RepID=A0A923PKH7_9BACT|nr:hypothetical protein [Neolewinella lacunae]MBC6995762.1 hypothetical protein [Neolewinella lacunae]MDN3636545.1 hypothetical protein [Neolewinella lacunae]
MKNLLLCLLTAALFTSCLEEGGGLIGLFGEEITFNDAAVQSGTGLPSMVFLESVTFSNPKEGSAGDSRTEQLGHVQLGFRTCSGTWCKAVVDDCGATTPVQYTYAEEESGAKKMAFSAFADAPAVKAWAAEGLEFAFQRDGASLVLRCSDCPGRTSGGFRYTQREVNLRVVR